MFEDSGVALHASKLTGWLMFILLATRTCVFALVILETKSTILELNGNFSLFILFAGERGGML